jgi:hypothetical protein
MRRKANPVQKILEVCLVSERVKGVVNVQRHKVTVAFLVSLFQSSQGLIFFSKRDMRHG